MRYEAFKNSSYLILYTLIISIIQHPTIMEENVLEQGLSSDNVQSKLSNQDLSYLKSAAIWAKFLAILGFIFSAMIIIGGFAFAVLFTSLPIKDSGDLKLPIMVAPALGFVYAFIGIFYFVISVALNRFSNYINKAWRTNAASDLSKAFSNLRNFFRITGWLIILAIVLYILVFVVIGATAASSLLGR